MNDGWQSESIAHRKYGGKMLQDREGKPYAIDSTYILDSSRI